MNLSKFFFLCLQTVLISVLTLSCTKHTRLSSPEASDSPQPQELLEEIRVGMSQKEVAGILGEPEMAPNGSSGYIWYLPPPKIESNESPYAPGTIGVEYSGAGTVAAFKLNPQYEAPR